VRYVGASHFPGLVWDRAQSFAWRSICNRVRHHHRKGYAMRARIGPAFCVFAIVAVGWPVSGGGNVTGRVLPTTAMAPADVVVEAVIEPNATNRSVVFAIESSEFYTSSTFTLDGEHAARTTRVKFRGLPAGSYKATVTLFGSSGASGYYECTVEIA